MPTIPALSVALGVSPAQVQRFIAEGIPRAEDKSFPLPAVINWLQERALRRGEGKRARDPADDDEDDAEAPRSWKVRKERAQALRYEFDLEAKRQGWLERDQVEAAFAGRLQLVAEGLKNLASYLGKRLSLSSREQQVVDETADRLIAAYRGGSIVEQVEQWQESASGSGRITRGRGRPRRKGTA